MTYVPVVDSGVCSAHGDCVETAEACPAVAISVPDQEPARRSSPERCAFSVKYADKAHRRHPGKALAKSPAASGSL